MTTNRILPVMAAMAIGIVAISTPVRAQGYDWTGGYIGTHIGYGWGDSKTTNQPGLGNGDGFDEGAIATSISTDPSGVLGGVQAGYNWQNGSFVFGVEGEIGFSGAEDSTFIIPAPDNFAKTDYDWVGVLALRGGMAFDNILLYAKGGVAFADINHQAGDLLNGTANADLTDLTRNSGTQTGWALGGGVEYAFGPSWTLKSEYLYMDFGSDRSSNLDGDIFETDHDIHTFKVGINYKFGMREEHVPYK